MFKFDINIDKISYICYNIYIINQIKSFIERNVLYNMTDKRNGFMNKQIAVSKNKKRIIETINSLKLTSIDNAEKIYALSEKCEGNSRRVYSRIKMRLINIEGGGNIQLEFNLTPDEAMWLLYRAKLGCVYKRDYTDSLSRNWPAANGMIAIHSITVKYARYVDKQKTQVMNYPFRIEIRHIEGQPAESGGVGEIKSDQKIEMLLSEQSFFALLNDTARYMKWWELAFACKMIKERRIKDTAFAADAASVRLKQLYVRKTENTILECLDSLKAADVEYAENIYSGERYYSEDGELAINEAPKTLIRDHSRITLKIRDTKRKTLEGKQVTASFALGAEDINFILATMEPSMLFEKEFTFNGFRKWNSDSGEQGAISHSILYISYQQYKNKQQMEKYEYPFYISVINRAGKGDRFGNKIVNVKSETELSVRLTAFEFFSMIMDCKRYMEVFEAAYGIKNIIQKNAMEQKIRDDYFSGQTWGNYGIVI